MSERRCASISKLGIYHERLSHLPELFLVLLETSTMKKQKHYAALPASRFEPHSFETRKRRIHRRFAKHMEAARVPRNLDTSRIAAQPSNWLKGFASSTIMEIRSEVNWIENDCIREEISDRENESSDGDYDVALSARNWKIKIMESKSESDSDAT